MAHALAAPRITEHGPEVPLQAWIPEDFAERFAEIARLLGVPKSRLAGDVVAEFVAQFETEQGAHLDAIAEAREQCYEHRT